MARSSVLVYGNFVALYYLFFVCVILSELPLFFIMGNNVIMRLIMSLNPLL